MNRVFGAIVLLAAVSCHDWEFGKCPAVPPQSGLNLDKFMGQWYVIEQTDTTSSCVTYNFTRETDWTIHVSKHRQFYILDRTGVNHTNTYTGLVDVPYPENQGHLRIKWPWNPAGKGEFIIFDTDYENYAGIYECQQIVFFTYRHSVAILSRKPTIDPKYVQRLKQKLNDSSVDISDLNVIHHQNCRSQEDADFNINVNGATLNNMVSEAPETAKKVADTVLDGVKTAGDVLQSIWKGEKTISDHINDINILN